jgi:hypothetical protein
MKRQIVSLTSLSILAVLLFFGCNNAEDVLDVTMSFSATQNGLAQSDWFGRNEWVFPVYFSTAPSTAEEVSRGHALGATVIVTDAMSNVPFYITGVRIEQVLYRPAGASSEIGYVHPVFGPINPFFLELPGGPVIEVAPGTTPTTFDVDLATALSLWTFMDADGDATLFPADQDEVISIACSLFFEGYMQDGTEFSGQFPAPLRLYFRVQHQ